jgi:hypothetical protein
MQASLRSLRTLGCEGSTKVRERDLSDPPCLISTPAN